MRHQPAIGDAYTLKIEKLDIKKSVENSYLKDVFLGENVVRDIEVIWESTCVLSNKIDQVIDLFNNLKFTVTIREAEQLSLFSKFFDKRVCVVCKGLGYKMARNPDKQEELIKVKCLPCDGRGEEIDKTD